MSDCTSREGVAILRAVMAHDTHGAEGAHHAEGPHPELPPVHDEAADSPNWLPVTGLALLAVLALFVLAGAYRGADETAAEPAPAGEAAEVAPAAE